MMEKTLVLIKPDAVRKNVIGKIISMYEDKGLIVDSCKTVYPDKKLLTEHYSEHIGKNFFQDLIKFMSNQKVIAIAFLGEDAIEKVRQINGATDPAKSNEGTIRNLYGTNIQKNAVHGSANEDDAIREIKIWFGDNDEK